MNYTSTVRTDVLRESRHSQTRQAKAARPGWQHAGEEVRGHNDGKAIPKA